MRPLIIDEIAKTNIQKLKENAEKNILSLDDLKAMALGKAVIVGNRPNFSMILPFGYRIVFSMSKQKIGIARELSMSVDAPGKLPNLSAVQQIMKEFDFHHTLQECFVRLEHNDAVYVMEMIDPKVHEWLMKQGNILSVVPPLPKQ